MSQEPRQPSAGPTGVHTETPSPSARERATRLLQRAEGNMEASRSLIAEREARHEAERIAERLLRLQTITASLARAITPLEVAEVVVHQVVTSLGASAGSLAVLDEEAHRLEILCSMGYADETMQQWREIPLDSNVPLTRSITTGTAEWIGTLDRLYKHYPHLQTSLSGTFQAHTALPLIIDGHAVGAIGLSFDQSQSFTEEDCSFALTMAQQCAQALERARLYHRMDLANRAKDQFLAMLSHELRTPLTPVLGVIQALEESELSADTKMLVEIVRRNIELEARLIDDLLDITRVIQGKLSLMLENVNVHLLVESVLAMCRKESAQKKLTLTLALDAHRHYVSADSARLQQVLWNLMKNAIKFTPEGGSITVRSYNDDSDGLRVEVADTGVGIDAEMQRTIFNPFEQGGPTITRKFGGLGLGLAISKAIVDLHGGSLSVKSDGKGLGAAFTLGCDTVDQEHSAAGNDDTYTAAPPASGMTILLVDDHEDTIAVLEGFLRRDGFKVLCATSVEHALNVARNQDFDLLISDIGLPDGTGIDLIRTLCRTGPVKGIALSGFGMESDIERSIDAGFSTHLVKPVVFRKLQQAIQHLIAS